MKIKIVDTKICDSCMSIECTFVDSILKPEYYSLRTESTVCPVAYLSEKPTNLLNGFFLDSKKCINCGLCIINCPKSNLQMIDYEYNISTFENLSEQQYNAIALSYLKKIFGFAANTNRNSSIDFDGYVQFQKTNFEAFVEVDYGNDSLESCRRLLGDFLTYRGSFVSEYDSVNNGIIVLKDFPLENSRDVYNLINCIKDFPTTKKKHILIITFSLLRHLAITGINIESPEDIFFSPKLEKLEEFKKRISLKYGISEELM